MAQRPATANRNKDNQSDNGWFNYRTKSFIIFQARLLVVTLGYQSSFSTFKGAIGFKLRTVAPTTAKYIKRGMRRYQTLCVVLTQSSVFGFHCCMPLWELGGDWITWKFIGYSTSSEKTMSSWIRMVPSVAMRGQEEWVWLRVIIGDRGGWRVV